MERIRKLLGLFTEAELVAFGNIIAQKKGNENEKRVWHSDVENFKSKL